MPLPDALHQQGILRYGFHGLSYAYIASELAKYDTRAANGKTTRLQYMGKAAPQKASERPWYISGSVL